jgi:hypothetical protein
LTETVTTHFLWSLFVTISAAGYEHVYEFANWIFGSGNGHSGVRMNIQHWQDNMTARYQNPENSRKAFFGSRAKCREFIQTGIACWSCSIPAIISEPCCEMSAIGGDGTHIGVSSRQTLHMESIWEPAQPRASFVEWGRGSRRPASFSVSDDSDVFLNDKSVAIGSDVSSACKFAVSLLRRDFSKKKTFKDIPLDACDLAEKLNPIPEVIRIELIRWHAGLTVASTQWRPLQQLLLCAVSSESISAAFPKCSIPHLQGLLSVWNTSIPDRRERVLEFLSAFAHKFQRYSMLLHVWNLVHSQVHSDGGLLSTTYELLSFLGKPEENVTKSIIIC